MLGRLARLGLVVGMLAGSGVLLTLHKTVTIVDDGRIRTVATTSLTVGQLLDRHDVDVGDRDVVRPALDAPLREGSRVVIERDKRIALVARGRARPSPVSVELVVRGSRQTVVTDAPTVGDVLSLLGWRVDGNDRIEPAADTVPAEGMVVRFSKVTRKLVAETRELPFRTFTRYDDTMPGGETRVVREGRPGEERRTVRVTVVDGVERSRSPVAADVVRAPVDEIVVMGTGGSASGESGSQVGEASWYGRDGLGAAHRWLPKGTRVTVTNLDTGASVTVIIDDRGPYGVEGRIIDLSREAFERIAPLSAGVCRVRIVW